MESKTAIDAWRAPGDLEVALAREREFSATLLDALGALVCIIDREGRIYRFNRACERLSGYTIEEVRQRPFWELLIAPEEVPGVREVVRFLVEERLPNEWENDWITRSGARRRIRWSNTVLRDTGGHPLAILGTGIDITERRLAEDERDRLLVEERRAREQAEQAGRRAAFLAEVSTTLAGAFEDVARVLSEMARLAVPYLADWCAVRIVGDDGLVRTAALTHVDAAKQAHLVALEGAIFTLSQSQTLLPAMEGGRSLRINGEARCRQIFSGVLGGLPEPQRERALALFADAGLHAFMMVPLAARGRLFGAMLFGAAREDRGFGEDDLVLAEALAARAALELDNARLYREAQDALQTREEFLVVASHELRTPLTSLHVAVQALLKRTRAEATAPLPLPLLGAVERSTTRLVALVDDLLDISQLTAQAPLPELQEVDLTAVVTEAVERSADAFERVGCSARWAPPGPSHGRWDRRWLARIVGNLLSNAAKYGQGQPVEITLVEGDGLARLTVQDHGIGIQAAEQAGVFERFRRAVSVRHYSGFGLGLWTVRRMVDALGGSVRVASRPGEGATFTVELPRCGPSRT